MKRQIILLVTCIAVTSSLFTVKAQNVPSVDEVVETIDETAKAVKATLNRPVIVTDVNNDTIYSSLNDTVESTEAITIVVNGNIDKGNLTSENQYILEKKRMDNETNFKMLSIAIITPCVVIAIALIALLIFLLVKNHGRNKIIEIAILNNYHLPESFYTGRQTYEVNRENQERPRNHPSDNEQLPPLPPFPDVRSRLGNLNPIERRQVVNAMVIIGIGLMVLLFFICVNGTPVGLLAGGIPMIIGGVRLISILYINGRN